MNDPKQDHPKNCPNWQHTELWAVTNHYGIKLRCVGTIVLQRGKRFGNLKYSLNYVTFFSGYFHTNLEIHYAEVESDWPYATQLKRTELVLKSGSLYRIVGVKYWRINSDTLFPLIK